MLYLETVLLGACLAVALFSPELGERAGATVERALGQIARRPTLAVVLVGLAALAARAAVLPVLPVPDATVNDEFSHLLVGDTLAHGRLSNPTPVMWQHLEGIHIMMRPTYSSMYAPAQGLFLAAGEIVAGQPFVGVCLSVALMCAAICWMLQAWTTPRWALAGGLVAVLRFGIFSYWANGYRGGAPAALGGALVLGGLARLWGDARPRHAVVMGIGIAILANSRPFEGLAFCIPVAMSFAGWWLRQRGDEFRATMRRVVVPVSAVLAITAVGIGCYNWRVTGSPLKMPYQAAREQYAVVPYFLWQAPLAEPAYRHPEMQAFYLDNELGFYRSETSAVGLPLITLAKLQALWCLYLGPALTLPLVVAAFAWPRGVRWRDLGGDTRLLLVCAGAVVVALVVEVFYFSHYAAPATAVVLALVMRAMRRVRAWRWRGRPSGVFLTRAIGAASVLLVGVRAATGALHVPIGSDWPPSWYNALPAYSERARVATELEAQPGEHLVIVKSGLAAKYDWIYNAADLDAAKIIWARDMGAARNAEIINYYPSRRVWFVDAAADRPTLIPYTNR